MTSLTTDQIVHGSLHSTDASSIVRVPLYLPNSSNATKSLALTEYLNLNLATVFTVTTGDTKVFFDIDSLASSVAIVAADATANTFVISGNRQQEFESGRIFTVAGSTGNNGAYISTNSSYNATTNQTTITVADVASDVDDGNITSSPTPRNESMIIRATFPASMGEALIWPQERSRRGRPGEGVYCQAAVGVVDVILDGFVSKILTNYPTTGAPGFTIH